ncbi:hypothetical protein Ciccas_014017, partial [Cichlidogyrus casuarinus]
TRTLLKVDYERGCLYRGTNCSEHDFKVVYHPRYIRCLQFRPKGRVRSGGGLELAIQYDLPEDLNNLLYLHDFESPFFDQLTKQAPKLLVFVHAGDEYPILMPMGVVKNALYLPQGHYAQIRIEGSAVSRASWLECQSGTLSITGPSSSYRRVILAKGEDFCINEHITARIRQECLCKSTQYMDLTLSNELSFCSQIKDMTSREFVEYQDCETRVYQSILNIAGRCKKRCDQVRIFV